MKYRNKIVAGWIASNRQDDMLFDALEAELWAKRCIGQEKRAIEDFEKMVYELQGYADEKRGKSVESEDAENETEESDPR